MQHSANVQTLLVAVWHVTASRTVGEFCGPACGCGYHGYGHSSCVKCEPMLWGAARLVRAEKAEDQVPRHRTPERYAYWKWYDRLCLAQFVRVQDCKLADRGFNPG